MSTDTLIRQNVILAAINMTGAVGDVADWDVQVKQNAKKVASLLNEQSPVNKALDAIENSSKFVGTLVWVGLEKKTGRFIAVVKSENKEKEVIYEGIRTEIGDWQGQTGEVYAFAKNLKDNLLGHRFVFFKEMQAGKDPNKKFRCLIHAEPIGHDSRVTDEDYAAGKAKFDEVVVR